MVVIYNGIDLDEFDNFPVTPSIRAEFKINKDTVLLGCIGRIEKRKGQEYLIAAMRLVDNAKLLLVGSGEEKYVKRVKTLFEEFEISDRVIHVGYRQDISSIIKEIDIIVFPTIRGEGFPRVILEAMAAGKPIVATDNAGNPEAVEDGITGYIVPLKDSLALARRANELVLDKEKRDRMGAAGKKRVVKNFTIEENVKKTQKLYLNILEKSNKKKDGARTN